MPKHCFLVLRSDYVASTSLMRGHLCSPRCRTCLQAMCLGTIQTKRARKHMCENLWNGVREKRREKKQVRAWKPREKNVTPNHYKTRHLARCVFHTVFPHTSLLFTSFFTHAYAEVFPHVFPHMFRSHGSKAHASCGAVWQGFSAAPCKTHPTIRTTQEIPRSCVESPPLLDIHQGFAWSCSMNIDFHI